jgi:hypothetical protein
MAPSPSMKKHNPARHKGNHHKKPWADTRSDKKNVRTPKPSLELVKFPYVVLPALEELECMKISYALFHLKNKVLMKLRGFLCFKSLASTAD